MLRSSSMAQKEKKKKRKKMNKQALMDASMSELQRTLKMQSRVETYVLRRNKGLVITG